VPRVQQGSIIRANVVDPQGGNPKTRPLVVISGNDDLLLSGEISCVAITGEIADPPLEDEVLLPWDASRRCRTGLTKRSGAKCSWNCEIEDDDVVEFKGHCPPAELERILEIVDKLP
jgi:hypothetical protein